MCYPMRYVTQFHMQKGISKSDYEMLNLNKVSGGSIRSDHASLIQKMYLIIGMCCPIRYMAKLSSTEKNFEEELGNAKSNPHFARVTGHITPIWY